MYNIFLTPFSAYTITKSDTSNLKTPSIVFVGNGGNIKVTSTENSGTVTFLNVASGTYLPLVVKKVWSASTTCTNIIGMY
jgi:hypothetical protein